LTQGAADTGTVGNFVVDDKRKTFDMLRPANVSMKEFKEDKLMTPLLRKYCDCIFCVRWSQLFFERGLSIGCDTINLYCR
jgi:hypothetical protein